MDDLPDLPFEQVLSYLSLKDCLNSRAVSRSWRQRFSSLKVKSLCFSNYPIDFIVGKSRLVSGTSFARNFISSPQFAPFFGIFVPTILSDLKHLRLCKLQNSSICYQAFSQVLNAFDQLEELSLFYFSGGLQWIRFDDASNRAPDLKLNLPMLRSLHLEEVFGIAKLTFDASALRQVRLVRCRLGLRLDLVHAESVERLLIDDLEHVSVRNFKNLRYLYTKSCPTDSTLLASLPQLKEVHLDNPDNSRELFAHKQLDGRADLKIYHLGLLLNDLNDLANHHLRFDYLDNDAFAYLAANPSRLADEIPFALFPYYPSVIERVAPDLANNILKRFTGLNSIVVDRRVENIERFLDLVKNLPATMTIEFDFWCDQPQELYDRLPEQCAVQMLNIAEAPSDLRFLFRLEHLVELMLDYSIDAETIRKVFENLEFVSSFGFEYLGRGVLIERDPRKRLQIRLANGKEMKTSDLSAAIHFLDTNSSEDP